MKYRKSLLIICLLACVLLAIGSVSASDVNKTTIANDDEQQVIEQTSDDIDLSSSEDDLISNENTSVVAQSNDENTLSASSDSDVLAVSSSDDIVKSSSTVNSKKTTKSDLSISAPKITNVYKKNGAFKVTVKDKNTKKPVKGIKLNIKVYTGNKYKTFTEKTNKNGIAKISTKSLSKGTHKVVVNAKATKKYKAKTVKSSIKIKKSNSKTTTNSKSASKNGKIATKITVDAKLYTHRNRQYITKYSYNDIYTLRIDMTATLKDENGNLIPGDYEATVIDTYGGGKFKYTKSPVIGTYGKEVHHVDGYTISIGSHEIKLTIKYPGNSKYESTTFTQTYKLNV